jgi:hypothetical protein
MKTKNRPRRTILASLNTSKGTPKLIRFDFDATAEIQASVDKGPAKFNVTAYTGGELRLKAYAPYPLVVDLQGMTTKQTIPALLEHKGDDRVGHTTAISITANQITASGIISGAGPAANEVRESGLQGFPWQISIGADPQKNEFIPEGRMVQVNGKTFSGPLVVARKTVLSELTFTTRGADENTSARIAAKAAEGIPMTFEQWLKSKGFALGDLSDQQKPVLQAAYDAEAAVAADGADDDEVVLAAKPLKKPIKAKVDDEPAVDVAGETLKQIRATQTAETKRINAIRKTCDGKHADIEAKAIEEGWTIEKTELETLRASRPSGGPYINTGAGKDATPDMIYASVAMSGGVSEEYALRGLTDQAKEIATGKQLRRMGLHQAMYMIAAANGIPFQPGRMDEDFLRRMFMHDRNLSGIQAAGGDFSTMSLSGLLENVLNKMLLQQYDMAESVVDQLCWKRDSNDFKPFKSYRMTALGTMSEVAPTGEVPNVGLQDETYQNQIKTQGGLLVITRTMIVNDDMSAITAAPQSLMELAMVTREKAAFTTLLSGLTTVAPGASTGQTANAFNFFSSGAKNYASGAGSALAIASMATARQKFREQKDANGNPIMQTPDRILVGPALETTADNLFQGANLVVGALGSTSSKSVEPNLNAHRNKYTPVVSPWFGAQSPVSGMTDTAWMLLGDPGTGKAPLQIGYLRGQSTPIIERGEANFNTLGIYLRCIYDFGVALHDYRTAQWSAGV